MEIPYPTDDLPATPEYVLAVLRDMHRLICGIDHDCEPDVVLDFNTTVDDWRNAMCLVPGWGLGQSLNRIWRIKLPAVAWRAVLRPGRQRTLADVCGLIAAHARMPRPRPFAPLGVESLPAGVFMTLRAGLHDLGANVSRLRPSSPILAMAEGHLGDLLILAARLAPGLMPTPTLVEPEVRLGRSTLHGLLVALSGGLESSPWLLLAGTLLTSSSFIVANWRAYRDNPPRLDFGGLETFGDLAEALARQTAA